MAVELKHMPPRARVTWMRGQLLALKECVAELTAGFKDGNVPTPDMIDLARSLFEEFAEVHATVDGDLFRQQRNDARARLVGAES